MHLVRLRSRRYHPPDSGLLGDRTGRGLGRGPVHPGQMQASQRERDEVAKPAPSARGLSGMTVLTRVPRRVIQLTCFVGAVVLVWPLLPWTIAPRSFVEASPFVALASAVA